MHAHTHTHPCMHAHTHTHIHACMHTRMHTSMHAHAHTHTHSSMPLCHSWFTRTCDASCRVHTTNVLPHKLTPTTTTASPAQHNHIVHKVYHKGNWDMTPDHHTPRNSQVKGKQTTPPHTCPPRPHAWWEVRGSAGCLIAASLHTPPQRPSFL